MTSGQEVTAHRATELVERLKPLLAGNPPELIGAVLADLLAIWLAGHHVPGDAAATAKLREKILGAHLEMVRALIPVNAKIMGTG